MKIIIFFIIIGFTSVLNGQSFYGSIGASAGNENIGAFWTLGATTKEYKRLSLYNEICLNTMWQNSFVKLSFIPQISFPIKDNKVNKIISGIGLSIYTSNKKSYYNNYRFGFTSRTEYMFSNSISLIFLTEFPNRREAILQLGLKFNIFD